MVDAKENTNLSDLHEQITALKQEHADLNTQVKSGELTKTEAQKIWKEALEEFNALKTEYFETRINELEVKYEKLAEENPERAKAIMERFEKRKAERTARQREKQALREQVKNGKITTEEMRIERQDQREIRATQREEKKINKNNNKTEE